MVLLRKIYTTESFWLHLFTNFYNIIDINYFYSIFKFLYAVCIGLNFCTSNQLFISSTDICLLNLFISDTVCTTTMQTINILTNTLESHYNLISAQNKGALAPFQGTVVMNYGKHLIRRWVFKNSIRVEFWYSTRQWTESAKAGLSMCSRLKVKQELLFLG